MKKYKKLIKTKNLISASTWDDKFELPDGWYSKSDTQDYFKYITKKHEASTNNPLIKISNNKIENGIIFKIITGYYHELLMPETMKLLKIHWSWDN